MSPTIHINDRFTVGGQPSAVELRDLAGKGFKSIVNLRCAGEAEQPLSPAQERIEVDKLGMRYLHIPVSSTAMQGTQVDQFRKQVASLPGPVFVHCHSGKRAGAFVMMGNAVQAGWSGERTLTTAAQMGFQCNVPALKAFVKGYVDGHRA